MQIINHPSPNHSSRNGAAIRMIVVHATAGSAGSALSWLCNDKIPLVKRVSAHYLIDKAGLVYRLVPDDRAAWHAGPSTWRGLGAKQIRKQSIGIELENFNTGHDPYPLEQINALLDLCRDLVAPYRIDPCMVVRHLDIAPKRKTDPAGFPWPLFKSQLFSLPIPSYRVKVAATGGATIRSAPSRATAPVGYLRAGDVWSGDEVRGEMVQVEGFGESNIWIQAPDGRCVWGRLLERVR